MLTPTEIYIFIAFGWILMFVVLWMSKTGRLAKLQAKLPVANPESKQVSNFITAGVAIGALIGFLLRPSVPLIGQLPFTAVITRGGSLQGLDQILVPAAQTSFNYLLVGGIVGAVAGFLATKIIAKK